MRQATETEMGTGTAIAIKAENQAASLLMIEVRHYQALFKVTTQVLVGID
jgi:hypothetical protein